MSDTRSIFRAVSDAIRQADLAAVKAVFAAYPDQVHAETAFGGTWLANAASWSSLEVVEHLVAIGSDVNRGDTDDGVLPLCKAAASGNVEIAAYLLARGSRIDVSESVRNPLIAAIIAGRGHSESDVMLRATEIAELLLRAGIDTTVRYGSDRTDALEWVREWGATEIGEMIRVWRVAQAAGREPEVPFGVRVYKALRARNAAAIAALFDAEPGRLGEATPYGSWLHVAAIQSSAEIAAWLVARGLDINHAVRGLSPLYEAARYGNREVVSFLLEAGAKLRARDWRNNALSGAVRGSHADIARMLLDAGIDHQRDALKLARTLNHEAVANAIASRV